MSDSCLMTDLRQPQLCSPCFLTFRRLSWACSQGAARGTREEAPVHRFLLVSILLILPWPKQTTRLSPVPKEKGSKEIRQVTLPIMKKLCKIMYQRGQMGGRIKNSDHHCKPVYSSNYSIWMCHLFLIEPCLVCLERLRRYLSLPTNKSKLWNKPCRLPMVSITITIVLAWLLTQTE